MNKLIIILIFLFSVTITYAQLLPGETKSNSRKNRISDNELVNKFYAGISAKAANSIDQWGLDIGLNFGATLSNHFALGGSFHTLLTQNVKILPDYPYFLRFDYGGLEPQFIFKFSEFAFHIKTLIGIGFAGYSQNVNFDTLSDLNGDWIFVSEPSLGLDYILDNSLWISVDLGWRQTAGVDFKNIGNEALNGPVVCISLKSVVF